MHNNTNRQGYRRGRPDWFLCPVRSPASLNPPSLHKPSFTALFQPPRSNHTCAPPTHRTNTTQQTHSKNNRQGHGCCRHRLVPVPSAHPGPRGALRGLIPSGKQVGLKTRVCALCVRWCTCVGRQCMASWITGGPLWPLSQWRQVRLKNKSVCSFPCVLVGSEKQMLNYKGLFVASFLVENK